MSEIPDDPMLDENMSRLLSRPATAPALTDAAEADILAQLKAKQSELFSAKEDSMDKAVSIPNRHQWAFAATTIVVVAGLIMLALFLGPQLSIPSKGTGPGVAPAPIARVNFEGKDVSSKQLDDGTIVIAHRNSKYSVDKPRQITLVQGDLYLIVAKSDTPFIVNTSDGEVRATGTRFTVSTNKKTTAAVAQGRVTLAGGEGKVELRAGEQGTLEKGKRPTREPAPRLSHLVSWAKEALSQEDLLVEKNEKQEGLIALDPWGQEVRLTLRKYNVDVHIEDGIARTTIDQTFFNHNPWNTEGTFYFPLPPDASVSRLAMYVAGKLNEGGMVERARGQEIYNEIRLQNRDPALLEMMEGNVFKMRIFPLEGRQEKRVFLSYTQTLEELYGTLRYWFPMDHSHSVAKQLSINVRVKDGAGHFEAQSSTHELAVENDGNDLVLRYDAEKIKPDQDLLLHLLPSKKLAGATVATCEKDGFHFVFGRFTPEIPGEVVSKPRQWIVLNDISASRTRIETDAQRYIVERLVQEADDDDSLAIFDVNTRATLAKHGFDSPLAPLKELRRVGFIEKNGAAGEPSFVWPEANRLGGTNLKVGIEAIAAFIKKHKFDNPHILYLGDGVATDGQTEVFSLVRAIPKGTTFVGIGVGKKIDSLFLQTAADHTGGMFASINPDENIDWRVFDLLAALNTPRLTGIKVSLLDASGKERNIDAIAYPNSRSLSEGETLTVVARCEKSLPSKIVLEGKVGAKSMPFKVSLDDAKPDSQYIPRLWAKRHIDELTKSDMERQSEIIELSKHYYVVTPFTSLIVLEDDKMYEEFKVERGRKDHWALYPAPQEIEVVHEPMDWNRWGWYGYGRGEDEKIEAKAKPQTVGEIVESVQFRIDAPFYYWQPQRGGQERHAIYSLLDSKSDPTRLLTYLMLFASGAKQEAFELRSSSEGAADSDIGDQDQADNGKRPFRPQLSIASSGIMPPVLRGLGLSTGDERRALAAANFAASKQNARLASELNGLMIRMQAPLANSNELGDLQMPLNGFALGGPAPMGMLLPSSQPMPVDGPPGPWAAAKRLSPVSAIYGSGQMGLVGNSYYAVGPQLFDSYERELGQRWSRINRDIQQYNRQYGYWDDFDGYWNTNSIDLRRSGSARWYGGLDELEELMSDESGESKPTSQLRLLSDLTLDDWRALPMAQIEEGRLRGRKQLAAVAWGEAYSQALSVLPGTTSIMAADYLTARRDELQKQPPSVNNAKELKAIEFALEKSEAAAGRLEDTGAFWGHQGWNYRPQLWSFQAPTVQVYQNYNWSFDLTRYTPGLYSSASDILNEVVAQYGLPAPQGKVDPRAKELIDKSRHAIRPVALRFGVNDPAISVASGDRVRFTHQTDMYLEERMICDGQHVYHVYDELGLAARRPATELRRAELRQFAPHLIEPVEWLAREFDLTVEAENESGYTLKLMPLAQEDEKQPLHMIVRVTSDGRVLDRVLYVKDEKQLKLEFQYADDEIIARWFDKDDKKLAESKYGAKPLADGDDSFQADLAKFVVIDMPLRKPSYYLQHLEQLGDNVEKKDVPRKIELLRHYALACTQELQWRRWGQANEVARETLVKSLTLMKENDIQPKIGDLTLYGSAGVYNTMTEFKPFGQIDESHPVALFYTLRHGGWNNVDKTLKDREHGLIAHLAAFNSLIQHHQVTPQFEFFKKTFADSPLLLAASYFAGNWGQQSSAWQELYDNPKWRGMALLMSSTLQLDAAQKKSFADAFTKWQSDCAKFDYDVPVTPAIANHLRDANAESWKSLVQDRFDRAKKTERIAPLLRFAEDAMSWGETDRADEALQMAREQLDKQNTLLGRFALAQSYWAANRFTESLALYDEIFKSLESKQIAASPALLASVARLAQQSGDERRAIELEEQALAAEQKYLPDMINLQAFRQRYTWLWERYQQNVQTAVNDKDDAARDRYLEKAEAAWQRWYEIDRDNFGMVNQMATLQMTAGRESEAWLYLSTAIDQRPRDAASYKTVSAWYQGRSQLDDAQQWLARAYEWDTANPQWLYERAQLLDQLDRKPEARELYEKILTGKWAPGLQGWVNQAKNALN